MRTLSAVCWFDAENDDLSADEIYDWSLDEFRVVGNEVAFVRVTLVLSAVDEADDLCKVCQDAFARVLLGPPVEAESFGLNFPNLATWIEEQPEEQTNDVDDDEAMFLIRDGPRGPARPIVWLRETDDHIEIMLPGSKPNPSLNDETKSKPNAEPEDPPVPSAPVPTRDWIPHPVSDFVDWMDRPPPQYMRDLEPEDGSETEDR